VLKLDRETHQKIYVGDDIIITICHVDGQRVSVGVEAPDEVIIDRAEVYHAKRRQSARRGVYGDQPQTFRNSRCNVPLPARGVVR
jgi:carbon storage regulator CsrA